MSSAAAPVQWRPSRRATWMWSMTLRSSSLRWTPTSPPGYTCLMVRDKRFVESFTHQVETKEEELKGLMRTVVFTDQGGRADRGQKHQHQECLWRWERRFDPAVQIPWRSKNKLSNDSYRLSRNYTDVLSFFKGFIWILWLPVFQQVLLKKEKCTWRLGAGSRSRPVKI